MEKIAYLMLVHNDSEHLVRLINKLNYEADFYVHIDGKVSVEIFKSALSEMPNVYFISERFPVFWGGFNMIQATNALLESACASSIKYKRLVLLSGADYPLVANSKIHSFFENHRNEEFIRGFNVTESNIPQYLNQIQKFHMMDKIFITPFITKVIKKITSSILYKSPYIKAKNGDFDVYFGSQWWAITPQCAKEMLYIIKENKEIDRYFKHSFAPDEKYFHTVFFNSTFRNKNVDGGPGIFEERGTWRWANLHHIDPSLNKWYSVKDADEVFTSTKLFIRKVNTEFSHELLKKIDDRTKEEIL